MSYLRQCNFCNLMVTFLKWDCTDDVCSRQMWPLEDAASKMRHSYCLYDRIRVSIDSIDSFKTVDSFSNESLLCVLLLWLDFFSFVKHNISFLFIELLYKINITFAVMQTFGKNCTHAGDIAKLYHDINMRGKRINISWILGSYMHSTRLHHASVIILHHVRQCTMT